MRWDKIKQLELKIYNFRSTNRGTHLNRSLLTHISTNSTKYCHLNIFSAHGLMIMDHRNTSDCIPCFSFVLNVDISCR